MKPCRGYSMEPLTVFSMYLAWLVCFSFYSQIHFCEQSKIWTFRRAQLGPCLPVGWLPTIILSTFPFPVRSLSTIVSK
jgi:hypothetical protein